MPTLFFSEDVRSRSREVLCNNCTMSFIAILQIFAGDLFASLFSVKNLSITIDNKTPLKISDLSRWRINVASQEKQDGTALSEMMSFNNWIYAFSFVKRNQLNSVEKDDALSEKMTFHFLPAVKYLGKPYKM